MAATVEIDERNGTSPGTLTHGISNSNFGDVDAANLVAATYPITAGANSYEKWQQLHVTAMGGSTQIDDVRIYWPSGAWPIGTGTYIKTNTTTAGYAGAAVYATPIKTTSTVAVAGNLAVTDPATANLGIGGSLAGALTATGSTDYGVFQVQTNVADTAGSSITMRWRWNEIA